MREEMSSLMKNNTQCLVKIPTKHKLVGCKWIYKKKDGNPGAEEVWDEVHGRGKEDPVDTG